MINNPNASVSTTKVHIRASDLLLKLLRTWPSSHISIGDLTTGLGERSIALLILLGSLPNCIPGPPGLGSVLGILTLAVSVQLTLGRRTLWIPATFSSRTIPISKTLGFVERAAPRLWWIENACRPRASWVFSFRGEELIGCYLVLLSLCVLLPVPLTNFVPALGGAVIALGLIEKDGLVVLLGVAVGAFGLALATSIVRIISGAMLTILG